MGPVSRIWEEENDIVIQLEISEFTSSDDFFSPNMMYVPWVYSTIDIVYSFLKKTAENVVAFRTDVILLITLTTRKPRTILFLCLKI